MKIVVCFVVNVRDGGATSGERRFVIRVSVVCVFMFVIYYVFFLFLILC